MNPTYINLSYKFDDELPDRYKSNDVRYTQSLVEYFVNLYTNSLDLVFDPFTGFGTTLEVAKKMGRRTFGVEIHDERVQYLKNKGVEDVICADIKKFPSSKIPSYDLLMTSPPFMGEKDSADALTGYLYSGSYNEYLDTMSQIFRKLSSRMNPKSHVIIEISNLKQEHGITTLAWDVGKLLSEIFDFLGEVIICWKREDYNKFSYGYGYDHSYCLMYTNGQ